jgi:hypothetical protein
VIHQALAGEIEGLQPIALDQLDHALGADAGAATWASMSPTTRSEARMLSRTICHTMSFFTPRS